MALSNFARDVANIVRNQGEVFASDDDGTTYYHLGKVKEVNLNWEPVETDPDSRGQTKQLAADITLSWVMQQTSDTEIQNLADLIGPEVYLKFTKSPSTAANAPAAAGYEFQDASIISNGEINLGGEESMISCESKGRVSMTGLAELGNSGSIAFGD